MCAPIFVGKRKSDPKLYRFECVYVSKRKRDRERSKKSNTLATPIDDDFSVFESKKREFLIKTVERRHTHQINDRLLCCIT